LTDREAKREAWRKAAVKALAQGLDRDKTEGAIEISCIIRGKQYKEREHSIVVHNGPRYMFDAEGCIKSIIKDGHAYDENGERRYIASRRKK
jgi:hypothetical protein